jgi:hypothetical protein
MTHSTGKFVGGPPRTLLLANVDSYLCYCNHVSARPALQLSPMPISLSPSNTPWSSPACWGSSAGIPLRHPRFRRLSHRSSLVYRSFNRATFSDVSASSDGCLGCGKPRRCKTPLSLDHAAVVKRRCYSICNALPPRHPRTSVPASGTTGCQSQHGIAGCLSIFRTPAWVAATASCATCCVA